ncbi:hypothetical protein CC80DRAFT_494007 [Byssothecium circinans]|uniref:Uncharacterized protein n=1 Tax=Byssothecium circinans TaxID=147558 RepID=A0A6A5TNA4_9PLEO|nr:hypothetical protein CC80DRAFT_494007 [Byssothecium circinans]
MTKGIETIFQEAYLVEMGIQQNKAFDFRNGNYPGTGPQVFLHRAPSSSPTPACMRLQTHLPQSQTARKTASSQSPVPVHVAFCLSTRAPGSRKRDTKPRMKPYKYIRACGHLQYRSSQRISRERRWEKPGCKSPSSVVG